MWPQNNKWKDRAKKKQRKGGRNFVRAKSPWQDRGARQREGKPGTRHTPAGKAWQWTVALHLRKEKSQHGLFWVGHLVLHCADYERPRLPGGGWAAGSVVPKGFKVTTVGEVARGRHLGNDQSPHSPPGLLLFPGPWLRFKGCYSVYGGCPAFGWPQVLVPQKKSSGSSLRSPSRSSAGKDISVTSAQRACT